jgi:hypothetical protein
MSDGSHCDSSDDIGCVECQMATTATAVTILVMWEGGDKGYGETVLR